MECAYTLELVPAGEPREARIRWHDGRTAVVSLAPLPDPFWEWQVRTRVANVNFLLSGQGEHDFAVHTGHMATLGAAGRFPVCAATKGIGLLPQGDLTALGEELEALVTRALAQEERETREERLRYLLRLYTEVPLDRRVLTSIELYGKGTWRNVREDPRCTVLFSSVRGPSYAVNGVVEVRRPGDPVYRFVVALHDLFHLPRGGRREYPAVYLIWAAEVWDKTPGARAGTRLG